MSVVDDVRKAMQDFLAPELRELKARVEALEKHMDTKFQGVDTQFRDLRTHLDARFNALEIMLSLTQRVARLEEQVSHKEKEQ